MNGIFKVKQEIAKAIDMDVMFITDAYVEQGEVVFVVMEQERFAGAWKDDTVVSDTIQHLKTHEQLEDIPF